MAVWWDLILIDMIPNGVAGPVDSAENHNEGIEGRACTSRTDYLSQATMHAGSLRCITQCEGTYAVGIERVKRRKDPEPLDPTPAHICA